MSRVFEEKISAAFKKRLENTLGELNIPNLKQLSEKAAVHQSTLSKLLLGQNVELRTKQKAQNTISPINLEWLITGEGEKYLEEKAEPRGSDYELIKRAVAEVLATDPRLRLIDKQVEQIDKRAEHTDKRVEQLVRFHEGLSDSEKDDKPFFEKIETIYQLCREILEYKQADNGWLNIRLDASIEGQDYQKALPAMVDLDESKREVWDVIFDTLSRPVELSPEQIKEFCEIYDLEKSGRRREDVLRALHGHVASKSDP